VTTLWKHWICLVWLCLFPCAGNAGTPMIAAGGGESLFLSSDGSVWGTGRVPNYFPGVTSPVRLLQLPNVVSLAASGGTEFALLGDGTLWGIGNNNVGQLGDGTTQYRSQPQRVPGVSAVTAVAANGVNAYALTQDGTVWAWGSNSNGQLGDGTKNDRYVPARVTGLTNVTAIAAGGSSALALRADGTVWVWGSTAVGSAGDGSHGDPNSPDLNHLAPTLVQNLEQVTAISAGYGHHLALRRDGTVWTWGWGNSGQNGIGTVDQVFLPVQIPGLDLVVAIDARGSAYSLALRGDGTVWAWGDNNVGQLGVSGINYSATPIQVLGLTDIVAIGAGFQYALALRRDGTVLAWGGNDSGQLGDNTLQDRPQPLPVSRPGGAGQINLLQPTPTSFNQLPSAQINQSASSGTAPMTVQFSATNATDPDGTVRAFSWKTSDGQQATGQSVSFSFAQPGTFTIALLVVDNTGASGWAQAAVVVSPRTGVAVNANPKVALGGSSAIALTRDGRVLVWGDRQWLGLYDTRFAQSLPAANSLPMANGITGAVDFVVEGGDVKHVLLADGTVLGWGQNSHGETGIGSLTRNTNQPQLLSGLPAVQSLAAGYNHSFAMTRDGRVFAWGYNALGQLGVGDTVDRFQPTEVTGLANVAALVGGYRFSAALKTDGTVWAWGDNSFYQLGDGTTTLRNRPIQLPGLSGITKIFPAAFGFFAQKADGTAWATGNLPFTPATNVSGRNSGAYRVPDLDNALQIAGSFGYIVVLKTDGTIWTGGLGGFFGFTALGFQASGNVVGLRQLPGISDAISVAAGQFGAMALRRDGTVLAWGLNSSGQIGDGTLALQQTPVLVLNETANGFLDLIPEVTNTIPRSLIPPFFLATYANGGLSSTTLYADLRGIISSGSFAWHDVGQFAAGYNVYVAAYVPAIGASTLFQLNANNAWSPLQWPMSAFMSGVALDSQTNVVRAQVLQNADLSSPALAGTSIIVGYGTDPDEMARAARYRTIYTVPQQ
jgi:alpha-tubulin suppressor-like RCC1 family protein